jgi:proteasome lid subunit RPN8/RPN11
MTTLNITLQQLQMIQKHAEQTYPEECCGILLGTINQQPNNQQKNGQKTLVEIVPTANAWSEAVAAELQDSQLIQPSRHPAETARRDRYWIDPQDLLKAQQTGRDQGLQIIGIYHSHPDHPAVPSESDRILAWSSYSYLIVSVVQGKATETLCWCLNEQHQFEAEKMLSVAVEQS